MLARRSPSRTRSRGSRARRARPTVRLYVPLRHTCAGVRALRCPHTHRKKQKKTLLKHTRYISALLNHGRRERHGFTLYTILHTLLQSCDSPCSARYRAAIALVARVIPEHVVGRAGLPWTCGTGRPLATARCATCRRSVKHCPPRGVRLPPGAEQLHFSQLCRNRQDVAACRRRQQAIRRHAHDF